MFITFEFLLKSHQPERIELIVSSPKEAVSMAHFLETTEKVQAFKMSPYSPQELGMAPNESWTKYRPNGFTQADHNQ
jgi:hypothetical protein